MDILQLLGSYCFPIVACLAMGWYVKYITDKNLTSTAELNSQHTNYERPSDPNQQEERKPNTGTNI